MTNPTIEFYKKNNAKLAEQYNSVSFESVHKEWIEFIPDSGLILDIGAGSGRDALWFSNHGFQVIAVEPIAEFSEQFIVSNPNSKIKWVIDTLPKLEKLTSYHSQVSLILLSAVWMHLTIEERIVSFETLTKLNKTGGRLIISLRHGKSPDERVMYSVSVKEIEMLASQFQYQIKSTQNSDDELKRSGLYWETVVLEKC
ncbi:MAG: methyltransferase domain-containing protein [Gammaproteobacteria bacterium]|nr:methyltransferase domain-containing protein [Gammaproteobacteria bacterium]